MPWITLPIVFDNQQNVVLSWLDQDFNAIADALNAFNPTGAPAGTGGGWRTSGLVGTNNLGAPNTSFDLSAGLVVLRSPSAGSQVVLTGTAVQTVDVSVAGPVPNGRDQLAAFTANSWVHLYFISQSDGTLAALASASAPPTGPTL